MTNQTNNALSIMIERARKVMQHEQRTNHQDKAVSAGGLEAFAARWADETKTICQHDKGDVVLIHRFMEHLEGYRRQDPLQRASNLRAALAILKELGQNEIDASNTLNISSLSSHEKAAPRQDGHSTGEQAHEKPVVQIAQQAASEPERAATHQVAKHTEVEAPAKKEQATGAANQPRHNPIQLDAGMTQGHTALTLLSAEVTAVPGVGPSVATRLHHLGIHTVRDLLFYFPREHRDYSKLEKIANIPFGEVTTTMGLIWEVKSQRTGGGRTRTIATISDETGKIQVSWFNQGYLQKQLQAAQGSYLVVTGVKQRFGNKVEFSVRSHELPEQGDLLNTGRLVPIYPLTEGLHAKTLRRFTKWVVDRYAAMVPDHLPASIR